MAEVENSGTLLVIGSGSFLARHFVEQSAWRRATARQLATAGRCDSSGGDRHFSIDVGDDQALARVISQVRPSHVLNCAGTTQGGKEQMSLYNVLVSETIFATLEKIFPSAEERPRVVLIGSAAEYGMPETEPVTEEHPLNPINDYGRSKKRQTELALGYGSRVADVHVARVFNLLGVGLSQQLVMGSFVEQIAAMGSSGVLEVGNLETARDFLDVADAVRAIDLLLDGRGRRAVYQLASGRAVRIRELVDALIERSGKQVEIRVDPGRLRSGDIPSITGSVAALKEDTGWTPQRSAEQSVAEMMEAALP